MTNKVMLAAMFVMLTGCGNGDDGRTPDSDAVVRLDGAGSLPDGSAPTFSDRIDIATGAGLYTANRDGALTRIRFDLDMRHVDPKRGHMFAPVGETGAGVVVMIDEYATRSGVGDRRCADGTETFVRVFSLPLRRELAAIPAGSCLGNVPRPSREATWLPPNRFRVETDPTRTFVIDGKGGLSEIR